MNENKAGISLSLTATKIVNYVNYQAYLLKKEASGSNKANAFSFLKMVTITNNSGEDIRDSVLRFEAIPNFVSIANIHIGLLEKGIRPTIVNHFQIFIDPQKLYEISETVPGSLRATLVSKEGKLLATSSVNLRFCPIEESASSDRIDDILASFVTPNEPVITELISKAAAYKKEKYGDSSFDAYQSHDPNEILKDIDSVYNTVKGLSLRYVVSPASYEKIFQRIRLPKDVLKDRLGNCLDLSLLLASIFEGIGLRPILVTLGSHAMVGIWLDEESFAMPLEENGQVVINAASKGFEHLCVLESTAVVEGSTMSFQEAKDAAYKTLQTEKNFHYALDIAQCRSELLYPIPSLREENGVKSIVVPSLDVGQNQQFSGVDFMARRYLPENSKAKKNRYDFWEDKLLDLNLGNKLINLKIKANTVQIMVDSPEDFFSFLAKYDDRKVTLAETELVGDNQEDLKGILTFHDQASKRQIKDGFEKGRIISFSKGGLKLNATKSLSRRANTSLEESGCNPLFITLGLIRWYDTESSALHGTGAMYAPLFLLPVRIPRRRNGAFYTLEYDFNEIDINHTLFEYFKENYHLDFSRLSSLPKKEDGTPDLRLIYNEVRKIIAPMKNWLLLEEPSVLSLFSFAHFVMWNDLKVNKEKIMKNKIVSSFVNGEKDWVGKKEDGKRLDQKVRPDEVAIPLNADSSQIQAILDAEKGESFILDGPPGTGKSQTIANMIVNFLYHGKKVLFVAEKEVALDVVKRRLDDLMLGQFTLELANIQTPKSQVLDTYSHLLAMGPLAEDEKFDSLAENIEKNRSALNEKISALHDKGEFFLSPYEAILIYLKNEEAGEPYRFPYESLAKFTSTNYQETLELLGNIASLSDTFENYPSSPFLGFQNRIYSMEYRSALKGELEELLPILQSLKLDVYNLFHKKGLLLESKNNAEGYREIVSVLRSGIKTWPECYMDETFVKKEEEIRQAIQLRTDILKTKEKILVSYHEDFLERKGKEMSQELETAHSLPFFQRHKALKALRSQLKPYAKFKDAYKGDALEIAISDLTLYQRQIQRFDSLDPYVRFLLGKHDFLHWPDGETILKQFEATLTIAKRAIFLDFVEGKKEDGGRYLSDLDQGSLFGGTINKFFRDFEFFSKKRETLKSLYQFDLDLYPDNAQYYGILYTKIRSALGSLGRLAEWSSLLTMLDRAEEYVSPGYLALYKQGKIKDALLVSHFEKSLSSSLILSTLKERNISTLSSEEMDNMVRNYASDLEEFASLTTAVTAAKISSSFPRDAINYAHSTMANQLAKLARNGGRGVSLRAIFHNYKDLIQSLTPCFMMSPISVAQFLDIDDYQFDVVIFDEASQIPTSEAIGAIARAKSVVIAGDEQQMPPTSFFTTTIGSNDNDDLTSFASLDEDLESLLDDAIVLGLPRKRLLWHYRSRHESLIAFSNNKFYGNNLYTFPSPRKERESVSYHYVKSTYERGRGVNRAEAKAVVAEIIRRLSDKELRTHSLGVVTFNEAQQNVVDDLLDKELAKNPDLNLEPGGEKIFIKNLENVQGDERDVILFSTTYGPDKNGTLSLNFGPLSLKKGERRLNVAVSRAREEMMVFSSIDPAEIRAEKAKNDGAAYLKSFLYFAKYGYDYLPRNAANLSFGESEGIGHYLAEDLRKLGYVVSENIGESTFKIDVAVALKEKPNEYVLGILCDNESFAKMTCRDRHVNEPNVLNRLSWKLYRVYSVEYMDHREEVIKKVVQAINEAISHPEEKQNTLSKPKTPLFIKQPVKRNSIPYAMGKYHYETEFDLDDFILEVIQSEGPISRELLNLRLREAMGVQRIGSRMKDKVERALYNIGKAIQSFKNGEVLFYAPASFDETRYRNYRIDLEHSSQRTLTDICYAEIANACADVLREQGAMNIDDLAKQVSLLFGYKTLPVSKNTYLQKAIRDSNCKRNRIIINENQVALAP